MFLVQLKEGAAAGINARGRDLSRSRERGRPSSAVAVHKLCLQKALSTSGRRRTTAVRGRVGASKSREILYDSAREPQETAI